MDALLTHATVTTASSKTGRRKPSGQKSKVEGVKTCMMQADILNVNEKINRVDQDRQSMLLF